MDADQLAQAAQPESSGAAGHAAGVQQAASGASAAPKGLGGGLAKPAKKKAGATAAAAAVPRLPLAAGSSVPPEPAAAAVSMPSLARRQQGRQQQEMLGEDAMQEGPEPDLDLELSDLEDLEDDEEESVWEEASGSDEGLDLLAEEGGFPYSTSAHRPPTAASATVVAGSCPARGSSWVFIREAFDTSALFACGCVLGLGLASLAALSLRARLRAR